MGKTRARPTAWPRRYAITFSGKCTRGEKCRFSHAAPPEAGSGAGAGRRRCWSSLPALSPGQVRAKCRFARVRASESGKRSSSESAKTKKSARFACTTSTVSARAAAGAASCTAVAERRKPQRIWVRDVPLMGRGIRRKKSESVGPSGAQEAQGLASVRSQIGQPYVNCAS